VIKSLNAKNFRPAEIYRQFREDYGENAMSMEWWEDGVGCSVKGGRTSTMMIEVAARRSAWLGEWEDSRKQKIQLFLHLKRFLAAERFSSDDEVKTAVQHFVKTLAADFFDEGVQKLVPRYDRCHNLGDNYVEK
jgi:hypothetical protein